MLGILSDLEICKGPGIPKVEANFENKMLAKKLSKIDITC
jgi:hypothetical protein